MKRFIAAVDVGRDEAEFVDYEEGDLLVPLIASLDADADIAGDVVRIIDRVERTIVARRIGNAWEIDPLGLDRAPLEIDYAGFAHKLLDGA